MLIELPKEAISAIKQSKHSGHFITTISIKSDKQTNAAFTNFVEQLIKINTNKNLRLTIVLTGFLYADCYAPVEQGKVLDEKQILEAATALNDKWRDGNKQAIADLKQNLESVVIKDCKEFFDQMEQDKHKEWKKKAVDFMDGKKCQSQIESLATVFEDKLKRELFYQYPGREFYPNIIKDAVIKFIKKETLLSAFYRHLKTQPLTNGSGYQDYFGELYPGDMNKFFRFVFSKLELNKHIKWFSYNVIDKELEDNNSCSSDMAVSDSDTSNSPRSEDDEFPGDRRANIGITNRNPPKTPEREPAQYLRSNLRIQTNKSTFFTSNQTIDFAMRIIKQTCTRTYPEEKKILLIEQAVKNAHDDQNMTHPIFRQIHGVINDKNDSLDAGMKLEFIKTILDTILELHQPEIKHSENSCTASSLSLDSM